LAGVVGKVAMTTLAAVLIFAGLTSLRPSEVRDILRTGATSRIALVTTFLSTLVLPVAAAVGIGVALSLLLQLNQDAMDLSVVELVPTEDGTGFVERPAPPRLRAHEVMVLDVYGSLLYAGARTLRARLPDPTGVESPAVVLRLRGRTSLGTTFFTTVSEYARQVAAEGGRVYLSGVDPALVRRAERSRAVTVSGPLEVDEATPLLGESTRRAARDAQTWLVHHDS
jgi:sulfate permease, SulP family